MPWYKELPRVEKKRFPCHDIATRVVLAIATHGVLDIATHEIISTQGYCDIQYHSWLKGWTQLNYIYCIVYCALHPY